MFGNRYYKKKADKSYYEDIDELPAYVYFKIVDSEDLSLLLKSGFKSKKFLLTVWANINDQIIDRSLKDIEYKKSIEERIQDAIDKADAYINDNKAKLFIISVKEKNKLLEPKEEHNDFSSTVVIVERILNRNINERTINTSKWLSYLKEAKDHVRRSN
jgi:ElaB/YqjD/DUF883 family membrane-anchored ribosome-binding protein